MRNAPLLILPFLCAPWLQAQKPQPVLMISIDGMKPEYVTHAEEHGLKLPNLRAMMKNGAYAEGVTGVFPTVTYPSHTTLITGVAPALHGVVNNYRFDPENKFNHAWYWYADQIKVPTLWDAAHKAGLSTASVGWPVTVDAASIDDLIPEYWRGDSPADSANPDDRLLMNAVSRPSGELARIATRTGTAYMNGNQTTLAGDEVKTVYSLDMLREHKPRFMTIHLSSLDEEEHLHGPFSAEANADLEGLDSMIGRLLQQELKNYPDAVVAVVSDHGFAAVDHVVNLYAAFLAAGLMKPEKGADGNMHVSTWKAEPWLAGGLAAIVLHDPADAATRQQVKDLLDKLAADPANGITAVLSHAELQATGGFPDADFAVTLRAGYATGQALSGPIVTPMPGRGRHGYDPRTTPEMRASFFVVGRGIAAGRALGVIDMRQIAPTIAAVLGVTLKSATEPILPLR